MDWRYLIGAAVIAASAAACQSQDSEYDLAETKRIETMRRPTMVKAGPGPVAPLVRGAADAARQNAGQVVVYIGATWCEPCKRFKTALAARSLDSSFPGVRFVEFDWDRDEKRLKHAGYGGRLIPRFVIPDEHGSASQLRIEGSIKGPGGVANITPRLRRLLSNTRSANN